VLHSWDSLQHGRYLFKRLNTFLGLEELLLEACGWAMDAWREHLATLEDSKFERISGGCPAWVLERLYLWDRELALHEKG
jgi:hypothetical protein